MKKRKYTGFRICVMLSRFLSIIFGVIAIVGLIFDADNRITWILLIMGDLAICLPGSRQINAQYNKIKYSSDNSND